MRTRSQAPDHASPRSGFSAILNIYTLLAAFGVFQLPLASVDVSAQVNTAKFEKADIQTDIQADIQTDFGAGTESETGLSRVLEGPLDLETIGVVDNFQSKEFYPLFDYNVGESTEGAKKALDFIPDNFASVVLFFNLQNPGQTNANNYSQMTVAKAKRWLDEGSNPADPSVSDFVKNYFDLLSYGELRFGIETPRDSDDDPLIPTLKAPGNNADDWAALINRAIRANPELIWMASGSNEKNGKRYIPSVVLVTPYKLGASATFHEFHVTAGGETYTVGDRHHLSYGDLDFRDGSNDSGRVFWGTLIHEYGHNFIHYPDVYGPAGATVDWCLSGDGSAAGDASEVLSHYKEGIGWISFKHEISGGSYGTINHSLKPYTSSGEAIKIVPDPKNTPSEYFIIEYRKSTANTVPTTPPAEVWTPDAGLEEEGLLITHINERVGVPNSWAARHAPYVDPEFADFSDHGTSLRRPGERLGVLFRPESGDAFTPDTKPSSDLYGDRDSGLYVDNIQVERGRGRGPDQITFDLRLEETQHRRGWKTDSKDRAVVGQFTSSDPSIADEIFIHRSDAAAILQPRDAKWFVRDTVREGIGVWSLDSGDRATVADLDDDNRDEILLKNGLLVGSVGWEGAGMRVENMRNLAAADWPASDVSEMIGGNFDGEGAGKVVLKHDRTVGLLEIVDGKLEITFQTTGDWDGVSLAKGQEMIKGRFTQPWRDEILLRDDNRIALFSWNQEKSRFERTAEGSGRIGEWNLGPDDRLTVADVDRNTMDEIYIRSGAWAGLIEWDGHDGFNNSWIKQGSLNAEGGGNATLQLKASDRSFGGTFVTKTLKPQVPGSVEDPWGGVLHVDTQDERVSLLVRNSEDGAMVVRHLRKGGALDDNFKWGNNPKFVVGDFHGVGKHESRNRDFIGDNIEDLFIHNGWGTATMFNNETNHRPRNDPQDFRRNLAVAWFQKDYLMQLDAPDLKIVSPAEGTTVRKGEKLDLKANLIGTEGAGMTGIDWAYRNEDGNWVEIGHSTPNEVEKATVPSNEKVLIRAVAESEGLTAWVQVNAPPATEEAFYIVDQGNMVEVRDNLTSEMGDDAKKLFVGDDKNDQPSTILMRFPLRLPDDLAKIRNAELTLRYTDINGKPFSDLGELAVTQIDAGKYLGPNDYRSGYQRGRTALPMKQRPSTVTVDVTTAVRDAWKSRHARGDHVEFALEFSMATDGDNEPDSVVLPTRKGSRPSLEINYRNYTTGEESTYNPQSLIKDNIDTGIGRGVIGNTSDRSLDRDGKDEKNSDRRHLKKP